MIELISRMRTWFMTRLGITARVSDEDPGWIGLGGRPNDRRHGELAQLYRDALEATRKNPLAKAIVDITTDFVLGDGIRIRANHAQLNRFLERFWHHPLNRLDQRLPAIVDELTRAGDLFVALFRNPNDGMSYLRFVTKEEILAIETAENDWETELAYHQAGPDPLSPRVWLSPHHPDAAEAEAIMLHYSINRPIGASFGEGDLDTAVPWLLRYSRMLEDRVRLHWAVRAFLWIVTVPTNKVATKSAEYAVPPESGSIIVKDEAESWEVRTPNLRANDARWDLQSVRQMIDAVGYPPHWRGEGGDANLATARSMQLRPERHLRRRQRFVVHLLQDLVYQAYLRAGQIGRAPGVPRLPFHQLFSGDVSDISRQDNESLAAAAHHFGEALGQLFAHVNPAPSPTLTHLALRLLFKFAGEPQEEDLLRQVLAELGYPDGPSTGLAKGPSNGRVDAPATGPRLDFSTNPSHTPEEVIP